MWTGVVVVEIVGEEKGVVGEVWIVVGVVVVELVGEDVNNVWFEI